MKVQRFDTEEEWLEARRGRITGTRLKDLVSTRGTEPKIGFYEILAERVGIPESNENAMDRGVRLEEEALVRFEKETGKKVNKDLVLWHREEDENIAISPDGTIGKKVIKEAVECKCLSSARHLEALLTGKIPKDYNFQKLQYFIVNDNLNVLYFVFYDPRMPKDFFFIKITREEVQEEVTEYLELERKVLAQLSEIEKSLTF